MTDSEVLALRKDTIELFYHGFDGYMNHAFPEDELKPLSCSPLTRDLENPGHIEVNDALGNYSLTLVDSLSTLAILASSTEETLGGRTPLDDFKDSVISLVHLYGDGTKGPSGEGVKSRGFDLDSKVQVFETVIRGVGGLLSAHLFSEGHLPIRGYTPKVLADRDGRSNFRRIKWRRGFTYDGQLLRLAHDLGKRLLPAFHTVTGLPYPRVNLKYGVPFYDNSPLNEDAENGHCQKLTSENREITETCSAGAGSLILEFTVLSRLTGDDRFETFAKRAFQAVWARKSSIGLIGAGIDAESGNWVSPYTGIGAGVDSFFEYAMKGHILLSQTAPNSTDTDFGSPREFLAIWQEAHDGIRRHLYRGDTFQHPHYIQGDLFTGASRAFWIDSLSAYYPGLLALSGELEEAIETHLLYTALWTRYSALPERWNAASGVIDNGLRWWGGRPEFIESTWYLYRATQDPWYLEVGKMVLRDIERRCWTECGWAGLEDVRDGELKDRMESFFLGETAKYLFLLFEPSHPLNHLDDALVFTTEGHPLLLPRQTKSTSTSRTKSLKFEPNQAPAPTCPAPSSRALFGSSVIAGRPDFFHAASLARLHLISPQGIADDQRIESAHQNINVNIAANISNPWTLYPWSSPPVLLPHNGTSSAMKSRKTLDLGFTVLAETHPVPLKVVRTHRGIVINSISGLKLGLIQETSDIVNEDGETTQVTYYRIHSASQMTLGRDETVFMSPAAAASLNSADPFLTRHRDSVALELVLDRPSADSSEHEASPEAANINQKANGTVMQNLLQQLNAAFGSNEAVGALLESVQAQTQPLDQGFDTLLASAATGVGAGFLPDVPDTQASDSAPLTWHSIFVTNELCHEKLPSSVPRKAQIVVIKRGGCSFSQKLRNVPNFAPNHASLQLVVVVSGFRKGESQDAARPLLEELQFGSSGIVRRNPIAMVMVEGGEQSWQALASSRSIGVRRKYHFSSQGITINNLFMA
ncbi:MAG: alpha mannosidase-like protein [Chrysothrix sp. TS-e1954]|nr:MAG: alpha mannosidase-like protein [Chrysothrix sp. TS-e1954]